MAGGEGIAPACICGLSAGRSSARFFARRDAMYGVRIRSSRRWRAMRASPLRVSADSLPDVPAPVFSPVGTPCRPSPPSLPLPRTPPRRDAMYGVRIRSSRRWRAIRTRPCVYLRTLCRTFQPLSFTRRDAMYGVRIPKDNAHPWRPHPQKIPHPPADAGGQNIIKPFPVSSSPSKTSEAPGNACTAPSRWRRLPRPRRCR